MPSEPIITSRNWADVARTTLLGLVAFLTASLALTYVMLLLGGLTPFGRSMIIAVALPVFLGLPLSLAIALLRDDIRQLKQDMNHAATYDSLTGSFNAPVFVAEIERRARIAVPGAARQGAFLIVEIAHLRSIQRDHGHAWSDEAMRVIAEAIRASLRSDDIVGRLGADTFGIFLPGASEGDARGVGERIGAAVARVYYAPDGERDGLKVSIGGVLCESTTDFDEMFRVAAGQVENARLHGVALATISGRA